MRKKYYSLVQQDNEATITIYGDITSWEWFESDISSYTLSKELETIDADVINVYINSYGGEVAEGLAIYNALKRHKAKIKTFVDGFACSIASVIFMAGDERIMSNASLLMIHNTWTRAVGNANELRKTADDLDIITQASINAYMSKVNISEEKLKEMLDNETWITPSEALEMGFATSIINDTSENVSQSTKKALIAMILKQQAEKQDEQLEEKSEESDEQEQTEQEEPIEPQEPEESKENKVQKLIAALLR